MAPLLGLSVDLSPTKFKPKFKQFLAANGKAASKPAPVNIPFSVGDTSVAALKDLDHDQFWNNYKATYMFDMEYRNRVKQTLMTSDTEQRHQEAVASWSRFLEAAPGHGTPPWAQRRLVTNEPVYQAFCPVLLLLVLVMYFLYHRLTFQRRPTTKNARSGLKGVTKKPAIFLRR